MARATDTHAELIKETARCQPCTGDSRWNFNERRFVAAVGFTEWRVNAFQMYAAHLFECKPSKAASSRFLAAEGGGEGWCGGRGTVFRRVGTTIHVKGSSSFGRMCALFVDSCFSCVGCVQFVETVSSESYEIVESGRFPGILSEQWVYFKPFTLERNRLHILLFLSCLSLVMAFEELNVSLHII